jgi:hypothetical protein
LPKSAWADKARHPEHKYLKNNGFFGLKTLVFSPLLYQLSYLAVSKSRVLNRGGV